MKIIIWGHYPLHSSTHGYIHDTYYKAFESLGYDVMWVSNEDHLIDYAGAVFFVEDSQKSAMPVRPDCKYITHHVDTKYFTDRGVPFENVLKLGNCIRNTVHFDVNWGNFYKHMDANDTAEDGCICVHNRHIYEVLGCKFAPVTIAARFAHEKPVPETRGITPFGFHYHLPPGTVL